MRMGFAPSTPLKGRMSLENPGCGQLNANWPTTSLH
jgi:hypothetical protein